MLEIFRSIYPKFQVSKDEFRDDSEGAQRKEALT